jgi:hypothetical protein
MSRRYLTQKIVDRTKLQIVIVTLFSHKVKETFVPYNIWNWEIITHFFN